MRIFFFFSPSPCLLLTNDSNSSLLPFQFSLPPTTHASSLSLTTAPTATVSFVARVPVECCFGLRCQCGNLSTSHGFQSSAATSIASSLPQVVQSFTARRYCLGSSRWNFGLVEFLLGKNVGSFGFSCLSRCNH